MKKLLVVFLILFSLFFVSCKGNEESNEPHVHSFDTGWTYDETYHWHASTCGHDETVNKVEHTYVDGKCAFCGASEPAHVHTYESAWSYDDNYHWHETTCGHDDAIEKKAHEYVDGKCAYCGKEEPLSETKYYTVSEACEICEKYGEAGTTVEVLVYGTVSKITNGNYGEMYITDGVSSLYIYGVYSADGTIYYNNLTEKPYTNDVVYLKGILKTYNDSPEMGKAKLQKFDNNQGEIKINLDEYKEVTIEKARAASEGEKLIVSGVVAFVTYANGYVPNGIYLVDNTNSIYIYSNELASRVEVGNTLKVATKKAYYILESEKTNAAKYGYPGSCQLEEPYVISIDETSIDYDKTWIKENTIKEMLNTDFKENNITTSIFKVDALVKREQGSGFVNYYFYDIDGVTGSYAYTLCNGNDFEYLKEFDGKICTVYLSAINCKSTASNAYYRLIPVEVIDENYKYDLTNANEYAIKYHVIDQFYSYYSSDPSLELISSVSSSLLGIENINITYESSDNEVISFANEDDKTIMHVHKTGKVSITCIANSTYANEYKETIEVEAIIKDGYGYISIKEALAKNDGETVQVKGIVTSSVVVKTAFYLTDDESIIAVQCDSATIGLLHLGDEVIISGIKKHITKYDTCVGQICIDEAKIVVNYYGNHTYNSSIFKETKVEDLYNLTLENVDHTAEAYVFKGYVYKEETPYSTNYYLTNKDKSTKIMLYAASGSQYSFLDAYTGEVTFEVAMCNWNSKKAYKLCVISVSNGTNKTINNHNFK